MHYATICSGIDAPTVAWKPLGWTQAFSSDIEPFPNAVRAHHDPDVPNYGDMTKFKEWPDHDVGLICAGTPCQAFSVAGLRKGLDDPRGNLTLTFLGILDRYRPEWVVWENVPGVLSIDGGRVFGAFLGGLGQLGYGFAYRVLDAQYFGVPQRRRRVFVVGHLRDWRRAAAVLFERHSLQGHPAPRREAGEDVAGTIDARTKGGGGLGTDFECAGGLQPVPHADLSPALKARDGKGPSSDGDGDGDGAILVPMMSACDVADSLTVGANQTTGFIGDVVAHSLRAEGFDASEDGTGRGTPLVPVAFHENQRGEVSTNTTVGALNKGGGKPRQGYPAIAFPANLSGTQHASAENIAPSMGAKNPTAVAFQSSQSGVREVEAHTTLDSNNGSRRHNGIVQAMQVRRLTPRECERLQGFPDDYTLIPLHRTTPLGGVVTKWSADGLRYKALGNSMAVPCMRWLGERIEMVTAVVESAAESSPQSQRASLSR